MIPNNLDNEIDRAFAADRAAIPADDPAARERLISMIGTAAPAGIAEGTSGAPAGGFISAGVAKILAVAVTTLGLAGGAYLIVPAFSSNAEEQASPVVREVTPMPIAPPAAIAQPSAPAVVDTVAVAVSKPAAEKLREIPTRALEQSTPHVVPQPEAKVSIRDAEPVVVTKDSVHVEVNVNMDGLQ